MKTNRPTRLIRVAVVLVAAASATLGFGTGASAHVTVNASAAVQGGYTTMTFRVPNEKANASTITVEVTFPVDQPIASVSLKPVAGWNAESGTTKLATPVKSESGEITEAVSKIVWTADPASAIKPGQFQEFDVSLGPLPAVDQLVFKALQTYSDGEIVRWIEEPTAGTEPEYPAAVLKLTKAGVTNETSTTAANDAAAFANDPSGGDGLTVGLAITGLILGAVGAVAGLLAYRRTTRTPLST